MRYWIMKSEPSAYSWADLVREGTTGWEGVRNFQASRNMKAMQLGDRAFFYHSVEEKAIVGVMEVVETYQPDPTDETGRWGMVKVRPVAPARRPVRLEEIKADPFFSDLPLVRQSRLSVSPVPEPAWRKLCAMGEVQA